MKNCHSGVAFRERLGPGTQEHSLPAADPEPQGTKLHSALLH